MAFSRKEIYGIAGSRGTLKFFIFYSKFALYIDKQVLKKLMNKIMLIMDNCSVHVALKVNEFWVKSLIEILAIASCFPNLILIAKVALNIK